MSNAVISFIILAIAIVLMAAEVFPTAVTALMACCAMAFCGASEPSVVFSGFSDSNALMLFGMMVLGIAMTSCGVLSNLSRGLLRLTRGKVKLLLPSFLLMMFLVSGFLKDSTTFIVLTPMLMGIVLSQEDQERYSGQRFAFIAAATVYEGGLLSLSGTAPNIAASGVLEDLTGSGFSFFALAPIALLFFAIDALFLRFFSLPITGKMVRKNGRSTYAQENATKISGISQTEKMSLKGWICTVIFFLVVAGLITEPYHKYSKSLICMTGVVLCLVTKCISIKELVEKMPWQLLILFGAMLGLSEGMADSGIGDLIIGWMRAIAGENIHPFSMLFAFSVISILVSQFLSATAMVQIILPIAFTMSQSLGVSFMPFAVAITACMSAVPIVPSASPIVALSMDWGNYRFREYGLLMSALALLHLIALMIVVPLLFPF